MSARRDFAATLAVVGTVMALVGARHAWRALAPRPSADECAALVDRYLRDKRGARFPARDGAELEGLDRAHVDADVATCRQQLTRSQVSCGLGAADVEALERCMQ